MSTYHPPVDSAVVRKRLIVLFAVVALKAIVIYGFVSGLATAGKELIVTILKTSIINTEKPKELPPPPPIAKLNGPPPISVVGPDININIAPPPPPVTVTKVAPKAIYVPPPALPIIPAQVAYAPSTDDYYPAQARRNNEEGRAIVHVCVNETGRVATADIATPSGHALLDDAALRLAKTYRFKPATQGGKPVQWCTGLPVKFVLTGG